MWEVEVQEIATSGRCGCSSLACCIDPTIPVGVLSELERQLISHHIQTMQGIPQSQAVDSTMSITSAEAGPLCCSKAEKDILWQALLSWRNSYWATIRNDYPFFSHDWVITNKNIGRLVDKACILLNTPQVDVAIESSEVLSSVFLMMQPWHCLFPFFKNFVTCGMSKIWRRKIVGIQSVGGLQLHRIRMSTLFLTHTALCLAPRLFNGSCTIIVIKGQSNNFLFSYLLMLN